MTDQTFNSMVKEDSDLRRGAAGRLAEKHNLPFGVQISAVAGGNATVTYRLLVPQQQILAVRDELAVVLGTDRGRLEGAENATSLVFDISDQGEYVTGTLVLPGLPAPAKSRPAPPSAKSQSTIGLLVASAVLVLVLALFLLQRP